MNPTIAVIIPTFGRPVYLAEAMESVAAQTYRATEIIVVDDASSPPVEVPRIGDVGLKVIRHRRNMGPGAARNTGLAHVTAELVMFLDDDDLLTPHRLAWAADGLGTRRAHAAEAESFTAQGWTKPLRNGPFDGDMRETFNRVMQPAMGQVVHRVEDVLQFDPTLRRSQDKEWWIRMADRADFAWEPQIGLRIRKHAERRPGVARDSRLHARQQILARHRDELDRFAIAKLQRDIAGSALLANRRMTTARWALSSMISHPSSLSLKLLGRSVVPGKWNALPADVSDLE